MLQQEAKLELPKIDSKELIRELAMQGDDNDRAMMQKIQSTKPKPKHYLERQMIKQARALRGLPEESEHSDPQQNLLFNNY